MKKTTTDGFSILGIGAAACVACCAGPILAFLGGVGIAGLASTVLIGAGGLIVTAAAVAAFIAMRRRRVTCARPPARAPSPSPSRLGHPRHDGPTQFVEVPWS